MTSAGRSGNTTSTDELFEYFVRGTFDYRDSGLDLNSFPKQSFIFEVRGARNLFVALCQSKDSYVTDQMYEFVLAGWTNTLSLLRKDKNSGTELDRAKTYNLINEYSFKTFWVSWNDGKIRLGQGNIVGLNVVLQYTDRKAFRPQFLSFSGWDVPVTVIVHREAASPSDLLQVTVPNYFQYYDVGLRLDLSAAKSIVFEAKAERNIFIALTQFKDTYAQDKMYEVLIGGFGNTKTQMRRTIYAGAPVLADVSTPSILDPNSFRPFWLSWADGKIRFGKGTVVGEQVVAEYTDPKPIPIYHLAIAGWDVFGTVIIHRESLSVGDSVKDGVHPSYTHHDVGLHLSQSIKKSLLFEVMAPKHVFIALTQHREYFEMNKVYEVEIGGFENTQHQLRKNQNGAAPLLSSSTAPNLLTALVNRPFWLSWLDGYIRFGTGSVVGENVVMEYKDAQPIPVNWLTLAGWDVPGNVTVHREVIPQDVIQVTIPPRYEYWDVEGLDLSHRQSIVIDITAQRNIFIALCSYRFTYEANRMYSFLLGQWSNTITTLRKNLHDVGPELVTAKTDGILSDTSFTTFWLSWSGGRVRLGKGAVVGQNSVLEYQDPSPIPVNYLAFAGWDVPGTALVRRGVYELNMANNYTYNDTGLTLSTCTSLVFQLKISTDAYLALTPTKDNYDGKIYEIVIGAFSNTCCIIRVAKQDNMVASGSSPNILDANCFRPFWISWTNKNILVGKGAVVGEHILAAYDEYDTPVTVNYLGITGFTDPGVFRVN
jgi:hypothetical protein